MFLGAHMMNDYYWPCNKPAEEEVDKNNIVFNPDLGVVALTRIKAGEELFVSYNIAGDMLG